ncbi:MAG: nucleotide exchange factor GrpE [Smithellaceae bacterium]
MKSKKDQSEKRKIHVDQTTEGETEGTAPDQQALEQLQEALEAKEKEALENYDRYMRTLADLDNYRKRAAREKADTLKYGKEDVIRDILPFVDSLDRALDHTDSQDAQAFRDGIALIQDQLLCCLKKHGVEKIESAGAVFDPNFHEALMQVDSADHQDNQVVSEMEKGYLLNGRLIRPSRVCVCKKTG